METETRGAITQMASRARPRITAALVAITLGLVAMGLRVVASAGSDASKGGTLPTSAIPAMSAAMDQPRLMPQSLGLSVGVIGSRAIVVDRAGRITQAYSNTADPGAPVHVRLERLDGNPLPLTPALSAQYQALVRKIDWQRFGMVYTAGGAA